MQLPRELLCEGIQTFDYSFRWKSSCEDWDMDEAVILDSEIATDSLVSDTELSSSFILI